ncbi:MAG: DUF2505 family protein [Armatimonadetes bacterium]|nr:DUF2505 family protein [Armatimonadota bacterium]
MPQVSSVVVVAAEPRVVYQAAQDVEGLAVFVDALDSISVVERIERPEGPETVTSWVGKIPEFNRQIKWTERDWWNDTELTCRFTLVDGDLDKYEGTWTFAPAGDGSCTCSLVVDYEYDVPLIGPLIKGLVFKKMQASVDATQAGLKTRAESV